MPNPVVGILHSARFGKVRDDFIDGLEDSGQWHHDGANKNVDLEETHHADGNYQTLATLASQLHGVANLQVVIAAGMVAAKAAVNEWPSGGTPSQNFPLLLVTGRNDAAFSNRVNTGGLFFENAALPSVNGQRLSILSTNYNIPSSRVCLLYNSNSAMSVAEVNDWKVNCLGTLLFNAASATGSENPPFLANSQINLAQAVAGAAAKTNATAAMPGAIIVSSDPFFGLKRRDIVLKAATIANVFACYPIFGYLIPKADKRKTMVFGPLLDEVYFNIGQQTAAILTAKANGTALPALSMNHATSYYFGKQSATLSTMDLFWEFWASLFR
jgi:hypothetical protein